MLEARERSTANVGRQKLENTGRSPDLPGRVLLCASGRPDRGPPTQSYEHLRACLHPGAVDFWIVYLCACGDGGNIRGRLYLAGLLRRKVQEAEERRWPRASPGLRQQSG